ncbi:MAG TPA: hypothetical protein VMW16_09385 [Sedimentisphaerales bacterium]|nr:hypothetical protein [Sedimentisphaerales bacterium]
MGKLCTADTALREPPLLVDVKSAAALLSISRSQFYAMHSNGRLGPMPIKLGDRTLWIRQELIDWTAHRCPAREQWQAMNGRAG